MWVKGITLLNEIALVTLSNCNCKVNAIPCCSKHVYLDLGNGIMSRLCFEHNWVQEALNQHNRMKVV